MSFSPATLGSRAFPVVPLVGASRYEATMQKVGDSLAIAVGFSVPLSTSMAEILVGLYILVWCLQGNFRQKFSEIFRNPIALFAVTLFVVLAAGTLYSSAGITEACRCLRKYREFMYIALFLSAFREARVRRYGTLAFMAGAILLMGLSYFDWLTGIDLSLESGTDYVVFKDRIVHNLLLASLMYLLAHEMMERPRWRWLCAGLLLLTLSNMLFLVQGRTGYLVLAGLALLFLVERFGWKGIAYAAVLVATCGTLSYYTSGKLRGRFRLTVAQVRNEFGGAERIRSPDPRMELYSHSFELIAKHPWRGTGTGSFIGEYSRIADTSVIGAAIDPHCEYLCLAAQIGVPGAALFILLLASQWWYTRQLDGETRRMGRAYVVTIALGCLVNSLILGFTGGLFLGYFGGLIYSPLTSPENQSAGTDKTQNETGASASLARVA